MEDICVRKQLETIQPVHMNKWQIAPPDVFGSRTYQSVLQTPKKQLKDKIKPTIVQGLVAFTVSLYSTVVGYASAYTAPALVSMDHYSSSIHPTEEEILIYLCADPPMHKYFTHYPKILNYSTLPTYSWVILKKKSWIGSLLPLSALVGGILGGILVELVGRKRTILAMAPFFTASFLMIGFAENVGLILGGRAVGGLSVGIITLSLPVYLSETLPPEVRGMFGLFPTTLGNMGILICFTAGYWLDWRQLAYFGACLPVLPCIMMFFVPETPIWYLKKGNMKKAEKAIVMLRGKGVDITSEMAELYKISQSHVEISTNYSFKRLFRKRNLWPLSISMGLMFFQQFSGINAMIFYTVSIFEDAGSSIESHLSSIIVGLVNLAASLAATFLIDLLGRKILLYISSLSMALMLISLGAVFYVKENHDVSSIGWLPLVIFVLFIIGFAIGAGPIPWLMMGEILPAKFRGIGAAIATSFNWTCSFIVTKTFVNMTTTMGPYGAFWLFGALCVCFFAFTLTAVPETQGRSLDDIEKRFRGEKVEVRRTPKMSSMANLKPLATNL